MPRFIMTFLVAALATAAAAQEHDAMPGMDHGAPATPTSDMAGMDHGATARMGHGSMSAMDPRDASGTSWQPASSPMGAIHFTAGDWSMMAHGYVTGVYDNQGGGRGGTKIFSESMAMLMGSRAIGDAGTLALRGMVSLDALMGKRGYPLLLATGETADGVTGLVDRQHPHDLLMELSAKYSHDLGDGKVLSLYVGYPGEPALGPPAFMHRVSGLDSPEAPIGHHWFDSTHITFGVVTAGFSTTQWKFEASAFRGREPNQYRYDFDPPKLDSWSARVFFNPTANLSLQASTGYIHSPEQLHPDQNEQRTVVSATYNLPFGEAGNWATTVAGSVKNLRPGPALKAFLAETSVRIDQRNTVFARAERKQDNELFENDPASAVHGEIVTASKFSLGYFRTLPMFDGVKLEVGGLASAYAYPNRLDADYGKPGIKSFMLFVRLKLAD